MNVIFETRVCFAGKGCRFYKMVPAELDSVAEDVQNGLFRFRLTDGTVITFYGDKDAWKKHSFNNPNKVLICEAIVTAETDEVEQAIKKDGWITV